MSHGTGPMYAAAAGYAYGPCMDTCAVNGFSELLLKPKLDIGDIS
jgi:hypothetical protein